MNFKNFYDNIRVDEISNGWVVGLWSEEANLWVQTFVNSIEKVGEIYRRHLMVRYEKVAK